MGSETLRAEWQRGEKDVPMAGEMEVQWVILICTLRDFWDPDSRGGGKYKWKAKRKREKEKREISANVTTCRAARLLQPAPRGAGQREVQKAQEGLLPPCQLRATWSENQRMVWVGKAL